ncbi:MAG TPA: 16S rRNA (guanine(527)-N(7))-methyltransferase RsmG, partial [Alphaproteobacteria bacterium]|nr:16S rRNA (guanine(527)-N(7))-methyltransferase RsmG [Alphaproteobacteria bacterium]
MNTTTEDLVAQLDVSRETLIRLRTYVALVEKWQARVNLIS